MQPSTPVLCPLCKCRGHQDCNAWSACGWCCMLVVTLLLLLLLTARQGDRLLQGPHRLQCLEHLWLMLVLAL